MRRLLVSIRALVAVCAWILFFYWWSKVSSPAWTPRSVVYLTAFSLSFGLVAISVAAVLWIRHSKRLSRRGKRGLQALYIPPRYQKDFAGRQIVIGPVAVTLHSILKLATEESTKTYCAEQALAGGSSA